MSGGNDTQRGSAQGVLPETHTDQEVRTLDLRGLSSDLHCTHEVPVDGEDEGARPVESVATYLCDHRHVGTDYFDTVHCQRGILADELGVTPGPNVGAAKFTPQSSTTPSDVNEAENAEKSFAFTASMAARTGPGSSTDITWFLSPTVSEQNTHQQNNISRIHTTTAGRVDETCGVDTTGRSSPARMSTAAVMSASDRVYGIRW